MFCYSNIQNKFNSGQYRLQKQKNDCALLKPPHQQIVLQYKNKTNDCSSRQYNLLRPVQSSSQFVLGDQNKDKLSTTSKDVHTGIFGIDSIIMVNVLIFCLEHLFKVSAIRNFYLPGYSASWWQYITHSFCHWNFDHLSSNLFMLYVFGRLVEQEEGQLGVWFYYIVCAVGGSLFSKLLGAGVRSMSAGASGAVFGLFTAGILMRSKLSFRGILEALVFGQFVLKQLFGEFGMVVAGQKAVGFIKVGHMAHIGGALTGVMIVWLLNSLLGPADT